jgi:serine/threonine-protein kinase
MKRTAPACALLATLALAVPASAEPPPRFHPQATWHQDISQAPAHPDSATMISTLAGLGGFGFGRMQIDFSMHIVHAPVGAPTRSIVEVPGDGYYSPDCEAEGSAMPVPLDGAIEGETDLSCDNYNGDCHLLVVQGEVLYEAYRANAADPGELQSQCLAVWRLDRVYPDSGRGDHCTSADAAGFPIAPLLFNADEVHAAMQVADGDLGHAIRFILPNARMASNPPPAGSTRRVPLYVRPASHAGGPSGPEASVPYGSRLRLRADFPVASYPAAAQVILRTMQRYGIVLSDGGSVALTAESDLFTDHSWAELGIHSRIFDLAVPASPVRVQDFAVIDTGARIVETWDCVRNDDPPPPGVPGQLEGRVLRAAGSPVAMVRLDWRLGGRRIDIRRNGQLVASLDNLGSWSEKWSGEARRSYTVCNAGTGECSNAVLLLDRGIRPPDRLRSLPGAGSSR